jgi:hypothetical protein
MLALAFVGPACLQAQGLGCGLNPKTRLRGLGLLVYIVKVRARMSGSGLDSTRPYNYVKQHAMEIRMFREDGFLEPFFAHQKTVMKKILGMHSTTCPETVLSLTTKLMVRFLRRQLGLPEDADVNSDIEKQSNLLRPGFEIEAS